MEYYRFYIITKCIGLLMLGSLILMLAIFFIDALWKSYEETYRNRKVIKRGDNMKTEKQVLQETVGKYCRNYRENVLKMDLKSFSEITEIPYKTLYSFESGLSSNLYIYYLYYFNSEDKTRFIENLLKVVNNGFSSN